MTEQAMVASVLQRPALVLNRNWQPVNVASVARALTLVWNGNARVVDPDNYQLFEWSDWTKRIPLDGELFVRSVRRRICVPEVVALARFDRMPESYVTFSRRNIFKRDRSMCQYCGGRPRPEELTIDHVVPRAQGGKSSWTNCVLACVACNHFKRDRTPAEAGLELRQAPVRPNWNPVYSRHSLRVDSWQKFVSEAYWNSELNGN